MITLTSSRSSNNSSKSVGGVSPTTSSRKNHHNLRSRFHYKEKTMFGIIMESFRRSRSSSYSSSYSTGFAGVVVIGVLLSISTCVVLGGYPPSSYYPVKKYPYLPAPPGETPTCAKHGATFCEKIETYPTEVVSYLLYKYGQTYQQFLKSESDRDFFLISQTYGPAPYEGGYSSPNDKNYRQQSSYNAPAASGGYQNYNGNGTGNSGGSGGGGYPNSYYRAPQNNNRYQREYGGYGGSGGNNGGGGGYQFAAAAMPPPMIQSMWWNHRDTVTSRPSYPYLQQHRGGYSRKKRQVSGDGQLCATRSNFIAPQAAMNNEGNWMYVVNLDDPRYLQMVRAEFCANGDGSPCNGVCNVGPGVRASCRQKYVQKRLVALDGSGERFLNDVFWFAHCCVCQVN
ncbi:unnamed protein product [Orchesella dallaii]|uniref:Spaetzle domain-containing protein n=1 Tax=Orchesella dallaii TaxID=48710 RepID=A0ABP1S6X6_9HEXA